MDNLLPVRLQLDGSESSRTQCVSSVTVPFTFNNESFTITQEDFQHISMTRTYTISKPTANHPPTMMSNNSGIDPAELEEAVKFLMNALTVEQQMRIAQKSYQQVAAKMTELTQAPKGTQPTLFMSKPFTLFMANPTSSVNDMETDETRSFFPSNYQPVPPSAPVLDWRQMSSDRKTTQKSVRFDGCELRKRDSLTLYKP